MALTDNTLNNFARTLSSRIAQRAIGLDDTSARIVGLRPSEQILAGFLTPLQIETEKVPEVAEVDEQLTEDLPQDSPYEQTSVGFEWLAPREALQKGVKMKVAVNCSVYVRRLPTFQEQTSHGTRKAEKQKSSSQVRKQVANVGNSTSATYSEDLVMVWTREQPSQPLNVEIDLGELVQNRVERRNLEKDLQGSLPLGDDLAPRQPVPVPIEALKDESTFREWLVHLPHCPLERFWVPLIDVRVSAIPTEPNCVRIALRLINRTHRLTARAQENFLDPNLYAVSIQAEIPANAHKAMIFRELPQSYRYNRTMQGVGINAHMNFSREDNRVLLAAVTVPQIETPRLEPQQIDNANPRFENLADDPLPILTRILSAMRTYYTVDWENKIKELTGNELGEAIEDREKFLREIDGFERGLQLLRNEQYPLVARAFRLMNETMAQLGKKIYGRYESWRLFQIVFIVSMLPILATREYPELDSPADDRIDLLWFAAGGGKTEAFLGLILWQAFFDRLRGKKIGVTAFVRFPLRLLTFQQLQRLGNALGQAELIRVREKLGGMRFSLGFFVGGQVTDNKIDDDAHRRYCSMGLDESQKRIFQCPFCSASTKIEYNQALRLIEHHCTRSDCPGGNRPLPIYIVDDDLYRYLPTIIVSTVDKMAGFGQNQRFANLLGRFDMYCPQHGTSFLDTNGERCPAARQHRKADERLASCEKENVRVFYGPFHDPGPALLIQDELHLLSEELGTFDSHYETAIAEMSRSLGFQPWRVIAATATIQKYEHHAWELYLKKSSQFPCPGPGAYESFYYALNEERIGRIFVGLVGVGRKHTPSVTRALTITYLELEAARKLSEQDLSAAAQVYGTGRLSPGEWKHLLFLYELPLVYTLTRKGSDMVAEAIESHVKKDLYALASDYGELFIEMFNSGVDVPEMIEAMQAIRDANPDSDPSQRTRGLVTTNIIGHGVDIDRFNIMIFAGFPRLISEYIQASARVGRTYPGISIFVATPQSERDRGVFNRFNKFHEYLDRLVDPSAIARWPLPALDRTVPGILTGYIMGLAAKAVGSKLATVEQVQYHFGRPDAQALNTEEIVDWMQKAYGAELAPSKARYKKKLDTTVQNHYATVINKTKSTGGRQTPLNTHLGAMRSLRDIDDPAAIIIDEQTDKKIVRRLIRGDE